MALTDSVIDDLSVDGWRNKEYVGSNSSHNCQGGVYWQQNHNGIHQLWVLYSLVQQNLKKTKKSKDDYGNRHWQYGCHELN